MKLSTKGLNETLKELEKIRENTDSIIEKAIEEGINIVTDELRNEIENLKTRRDEEDSSYPTKANQKNLLNSLGYTPVKTDGSVFDAKAGFKGLDNHKTKAYPAGHPNAVIASAINHGTSFMQPQPFLNKAAKKARKKAIEKMDEIISKGIKKYNH